jgi:DNA ligase (NAD+)
MEKLDAYKRIEKLRELINYHNDLYNTNVPEISDEEYDKLYFELVELEEMFPSLIDENSPTQKIRYEVVSELKKVKHEYQPMLSLDKTKDIDKIAEFLEDKEWIAMLKLDGLTCRLTYNKGKLVRAETRGNGEVGEDITHNAMVIPSIPKYISYKDVLVVDGEMMCLPEDFKQFESEYANCRNFAAGSIRLLDSKECEKRHLTFVAWDVITGYDEEADDRLNKKLTRLLEYNFLIVPYVTSFYANSIDEAINFLKNETVKYPIDGIVFKYNKNNEYNKAGKTEHHFRGGLAYKFYDEMTYTTLEDIKYTMGRTGILTPVAIFKPVDIEGAEISRASLHNLTILHQTLGDTPHYGQKVGVFRANMINPQIGDADKSEYDIQAFLFDIPNKCPICGGEVVVKKDNESEFLMCDNPQCSGKLINIIDHYCSKKGLEIKGLSKATLEKLVDWGWIDNITDLYTLKNHREEWIKKAGFGVKSVDKILDAIENSKNCTLEAFISALGIPLIGRAVAKELCNYIFSYEDLREKIDGGFDFTSIHGFGEAMHNAIVNFNYDNADKIISLLTIATSTQSIPQTKEEINVTVCITGKLINYKSRDLLKSEIEARGGKVTSSVTAKTDYLIANKEEDTNKYNTALKLGIPIITESDFVAKFLDK